MNMSPKSDNGLLQVHNVCYGTSLPSSSYQMEGLLEASLMPTAQQTAM